MRTLPASRSRRAGPPGSNTRRRMAASLRVAAAKSSSRGGVYGSPQLLQLSGLGPAEHCRQVGVPVVRDMPGVGTHLHDHFNTYLVWRCSQPVTDQRYGDRAGCASWWRARNTSFTRSGHLSNAGIYAGALSRATRASSSPTCRSTCSAGARWSGCAPASSRTLLSLYAEPGASAPGRPRHGAPEEPRPAGAAGDPVQLPRQRYDIQALIFGSGWPARSRRSPP